MNGELGLGAGSNIVLIGSPNSGKSLLFNRLTGMQQKVANFPGITVDVASAKMAAAPEVTLIDFPGAYSLQPISGEEQVAVDCFRQALAAPSVVQVFCLIDVTRLEKSLYFTLQVIRECARYGKRVCVLANMVDVLDKHGISVNLSGLADEIKAPVLPISARSGRGLEAVIEHAQTACQDAERGAEKNAAHSEPSNRFQSESHSKSHSKSQSEPHSELGNGFQSKLRDESRNAPQSESHGHNNPHNNPTADTPDAILRGEAHRLARKYGPKGDLLVRSQNRLDSFFLHSALGGVAFFTIMYLLFQSIFTWAAPAMNAVESTLGAIADWVVPALGWRLLQDFTADALFSGIGAFLVFVPQIFVLTFIIGILEDSGYMARAALICHKPLRLFGLTGKSFIPMLSGVACAIPGIYAARSIDSPKKRLLTYMAIPLMPCSARLPVYTLLIAAFIPNNTALGGLVGTQGLAMFAVYFLGLFAGLVVTGLVSRSREDHYTDLPFVLEMPPYRVPAWSPLVRNAWNRCKHFVTKAGLIIFTVTVTVWFLGYFPNHGADLGASWLGQFGQIIEPLFAPLGLDWRYGVAIMTSFLAREVFVGTLGTMFGIEGAEENMVPLVEQIQASGLPLASGVALLFFFAIALMCVSTLAILSKESGSRGLAWRLFAAYGVLAYIGAVLVYQLVSLLVP